MKNTDRKLHKKYDRLFNLIRNLTSKIDPEKALEAIIDAAIDITGATSGTLILIDWEEKILEIKVMRGFSKYSRKIGLRVGEGITGRVARTGKALLVPDVKKNPHYVKIKHNIRSELAVPLLMDRKVIGVVNVDAARREAFTRDDLKLLTILAAQSAQVIKNANLYETIQQQADETRTLNEVSKMITETLDLDRVLNLIVQKTTQLMRTRICSIMLVTADELSIKAVYGSSDAYIQKPNLKIKKSLIGRVIRTGKPLKVVDVLRQKNYHYPDIAKKEGVRSLLSVPLRAQDKTIGCLNTYKKEPVRFTEDEIETLTSFANQSAIAIENARLYQDIIQMENELRRLEKLTTAGEIAVGIAHEIRNPLTIVNMLFQDPDQMNQKDVEVIRKELKRINNVVSYFLNFYRLKKPAFKDRQDVNEILKQTLVLVGKTLQRKNIALARSFSKDLPEIRGDAGQLSQVFLNLILNAIDGMGEEGKLSIRTGVDKKQNRVRIHVRDTGPGIPKYMQGKIFQPFITTKKNGLGLGLSIVKRIVEAHRGTIEFKTGSRGTVFVISIPAGAKRR